MKLREPLEKRVKSMAKSKKIVLFIVEGITEETSLALILSRIIEKDKLVKFKIINGDITTQFGTSSNNVLNKITNVIKEFIGNVFKKSDIERVVHLVDMDGAYISDNLILYEDTDTIIYKDNNIYAKNVDGIIRRNRQKSQVINKLIESDKVYKDIPYEIYFFSTNLEHVLHNNQMANDNEKNRYALEFEDRFADNPDSFISFINNPDFAVGGKYLETWSFIKLSNNSLKRYTNFQIYINKY